MKREHLCKNKTFKLAPSKLILSLTLTNHQKNYSKKQKKINYLPTNHIDYVKK